MDDKPKSFAGQLLGYDPKPPRDKTWIGIISLGIICFTLIAITWMITHA